MHRGQSGRSGGENRNFEHLYPTPGGQGRKRTLQQAGLGGGLPQFQEGHLNQHNVQGAVDRMASGAFGFHHHASGAPHSHAHPHAHSHPHPHGIHGMQQQQQMVWHTSASAFNPPSTLDRQAPIDRQAQMAMASLPHHFSQRPMGVYEGTSSTSSPFMMEQQRAIAPPLHHLNSPPHHQPGEGGFSGGRRRTDQGPRWRGTPNGARDGGEETDHEGGESYWFRKVNGVDAGAAAGGVSPIHYAFQASGSQDSLDASEANHLGFLAGDASGTATDNPNMVALMEVAAHNVELKQQLRLVTLELVHLQSQVEKQQMHQQMDRQQQEWKSRYWTAQEHQRFLEALKVHGQKDFKSIASFVGSRSSTQVKTHAQKYFQKLAKQKQHTGHRGGDGNASSSTPDDEAGSTSREESRGSSGETESGSGTGISTAPFFGSTEGEDMSSSLGGYCCSEESSREGRKSSSDPQSSASPASS